MKTRLIVSAVTLAALTLGSMPSFAHDSYDGRWRGVAPSEPPQGSQGRRDWREHEHRRYQHNRGAMYQQPGYVYQQPAYVYQQPGYVYQQPYYDNSDATDAVFAAIIGGVIAGAIANH